MYVLNMLRGFAVQTTEFTDKEGWRHALVVIKGGYAFPPDGGEPEPLPDEAFPLAMKDEFVGEAGLSAMIMESDFASRKAFCDVIFNSKAQAPGGRPVKELDVAVQVGALRKALHVVGDRYWEKDLLITRSSQPEPFVSVDLHYGNAFGGSRPYERDGETLYDTYVPNPVGTGYCGQPEAGGPHGLRLPNLEWPGRPVRRPDEAYPAVALSPLARNTPGRISCAGTYDEHWKKNIAPLLPPDFDEMYFQCAPEDQRIPYPSGGEGVQLVNLVPGRPRVEFRLPPLPVMRIKALRRDMGKVAVEALPDTLFFETEAARFSVIWRGSFQLGHKGLHEIKIMTIGDVCPLWWEGLETGLDGCGGCEAFDPASPPPGCPHSEDFRAHDSRLEVPGGPEAL